VNTPDEVIKKLEEIKKKIEEMSVEELKAAFDECQVSEESVKGFAFLERALLGKTHD
jgi:hypothetical protein